MDHAGRTIALAGARASHTWVWVGMQGHVHEPGEAHTSGMHASGMHIKHLRCGGVELDFNQSLIVRVSVPSKMTIHALVLALACR